MLTVNFHIDNFLWLLLSSTVLYETEQVKKYDIWLEINDINCLLFGFFVAFENFG